MAYVRPIAATCDHCNRRFDIGPIGRVPRYCRPACRTAACNAKRTRPGNWPSAEDRTRRVMWSVLQDAGIIASDRPLPPKREDVA